MISPVFLFLFVSMLLSNLAGARADTILKFFIELIDFWLSLFIRLFYLAEFLLKSLVTLFFNCRADWNSKQKVPGNPFPDKRRPKEGLKED